MAIELTERELQLLISKNTGSLRREYELTKELVELMEQNEKEDSRRLKEQAAEWAGDNNGWDENVAPLLWAMAMDDDLCGKIFGFVKMTKQRREYEMRLDEMSEKLTKMNIEDEMRKALSGI